MFFAMIADNRDGDTVVVDGNGRNIEFVTRNPRSPPSTVLIAPRENARKRDFVDDFDDDLGLKRENGFALRRRSGVARRTEVDWIMR